MPTTAPRDRTPATAPLKKAPAPSRPVKAAPSRPPAPAASTRRPGAPPAVRLAQKPKRAGTGKGAASEETPAPRVPDKRAAEDPRFKRVVEKLNKNAKNLRKHPPPKQKADEAQAASQRQPKERAAIAQEQKVGEMQAAEGKKPESMSFLELLRAEIDKAMPKTLGDTEDFMDSDQQRELKGGVTGNIDQQKEEATGPIQTVSEKPPNEAVVPERPVTDLPADTLPQAPVTPLNAASGMPAKKTEAEVSLQQSKVEADKQLTDANVTPVQLQKANDPRFSAVLDAREAVKKNADAAPQQFRKAEGATLSKAAAQANASEGKGVGQLKGVQGKAGQNVKSRQQLAKEKDEARRREVTEKIEGMFKETKEKVEKKLANLETAVSTLFDLGIAEAMRKMKEYIDVRKNAWKSRRYGGWGGGALWLKDKLLGLPDEVNVFYEEGRKVFIKEMDDLVVRIAALVEAQLKAAKDEVAAGQKKIADYVQTLDDDLKGVGKAAEAAVSERFDELRQGIEDKKQDLARNLAQKYKDARDKAEESLKEMKEADKGLLVRLKEKLAEIARILREFKTKVLAMLKKAQNAVELIVADPIGFLKNLLAAVKKGFSQFTDNIEEHMKAGFMAWMFGALSGAGIELPKEFTIASVFKLVLQVLGLTPQAMRAKMVKLVGERNVALVEHAWDIVRKLIEGGPEALWAEVKEYLSDLKERLVDTAREWLIGQIIKAAALKLVSLFNPVGAIIQAILMIYNTVMFFIERINQILALVEAIIESVYNIATGAIDAAANWIEKTLVRTIPVIIAFLARLLGISGITERIKDFIFRIQAKVHAAIDKVIAKIVSGIKKGVKGATGVVRKIATWLGLRKDFTADDESHSLYFEKGQKPDLILASTPVHIKTWLNKRRDELEAQSKFTGPKKAAYDAITKALEQIGKLVYPTDKPAPDQEKLVKGHMDTIAANVKIIGFKGTDVPVPRMVVTPGFSGTPATDTTVKYLFDDPANHRPGEGTSGKEELGGAWDKLKALKISRKYWKSGHMLNAVFGGLAVDSNLIPIPATVNTLHETQFDSKVKKDLYFKKKVIWMKFTVKREHPAADDPKKLFVSYFKAEAAEMPLDPTTKGYKTPTSRPYKFEKNIDYPSRFTSAFKLNELIKAQTAKNREIEEVAKSNNLQFRLVKALVFERGGKVVTTPRQLANFINSKLADWGADRVKSYLDNLEKYKDSIDFTE